VRTLEIIGIGMGDPEQLTLAAVAALARVDVVLLVDKGETTRDLVDLRAEILDRHGKPGRRSVEIADPRRDRTSPDYRGAVIDWHRRRVEAYERALLEHVDPDRTAGILVWGDPALYDSTIRIIEGIRARGVLPLDVRVTPAISAVQALAAAHGVVLHGIGEPLLITTGRRLARDIDAGIPNLVVMLDGEFAGRALTGRGLEILWGAYLGDHRQRLVRGPLDEVVERIIDLRERLRAEHGWIMDTYLLRPGDLPDR
jgi:precorrin-6A synthase